jgi:hypothetical protein
MYELPNANTITHPIRIFHIFIIPIFLDIPLDLPYNPLHTISTGVGVIVPSGVVGEDFEVGLEVLGGEVRVD